ncbi:MAG: MBL fold metallo-hydrolase [Hymenobacter sp.]
MSASVHYRRNEALRTIRPGYPGNKLIGSEFCNGEVLFEPQFSTLVRWQLTANPQKEEKKRDTWTPGRGALRRGFFSTEDMLVWLGHAGFLLRVAGVSLVFDPVLFSSVGLRHRHALPCRPEDVRNVDYLLLSHAHRDHLDEQTIKALAQHNPQMKGALGAGRGGAAARHSPYPASAGSRLVAAVRPGARPRPLSCTTCLPATGAGAGCLT